MSDTDTPYKAHAHNLAVAMAIHCKEMDESKWWQFRKRSESLIDMRRRFTASRDILDSVLVTKDTHSE